MKTPRINDGTRQRRTERAEALVARFRSDKRKIEKCVWQDEKDFTLEVPLNPQNCRVYGEGTKSDIEDTRLFHQSNKQSVKVMVSACITWNGATKPFFVTGEGLKVNAVSYKKHLEKELIPDIEKVVKKKHWIFLQDSAPSHRAKIVQNLLDEKLGKRFIKSGEWPPASPDCNPLDYYFWNRVKSKVYGDRFNQAFKDTDELKKKIRKV